MLNKKVSESTMAKTGFLFVQLIMTLSGTIFASFKNLDAK
jgi:hypothetical protein